MSGFQSHHKGGLPARLQHVYDAYLPRIYGYVAARIDNRHDTEDVVSEVFLKTAAQLERLRSDQPEVLTTWLFTVARNTIHDYYRRKSPMLVPYDILEDTPANGLSPEAALSQTENSTHLRQLLRTLSPRRQEVIILKFFAGLRNQEIATVLELDERTVASHLSRGLQDLYSKFQTAEIKESDDVGQG